MRKTGRIWSESVRNRAQTVRRVCELLEKAYGTPRLGNPSDSLDDLVYIIISNRTSPNTASHTYETVKATYPTWNALADTSPDKLSVLLQPAGLSSVKSSQIWRALNKIKRDFGECNLNSLGSNPIEEVQKYLVSLPGVSEKVARCVMMYTMDAQVLPVDGHVYRITKRLGWTARGRAAQCHEELEALIPPNRRYVFHVGCICHGRTICRPGNPGCMQCCVNRYCDHFKNLSEE